MYITNYRRRFNAVFILFFIIFVICILRLLYIQFFRSQYLNALANKQHNLFVEIEPRRGAIYDSTMHPLAINISVDSVYASPKDMQEDKKDNAARRLSSILYLDYDSVREKLSRKKSFVWVARKITPEQSLKLRAEKIKGIGLIKETKRCYPNSYLAAHVVGFAGLDNSGLEGIEAKCDQYLKGQPGWAIFLRDARQNKLDFGQEMMLPKDGNDVILTIDEVIQYIAERELDKVFKHYRANGASIIVMDPHTGAILALANRPSYDLNNYSKSSKDDIRNRAIADMFEPGSVFKIVTACASLEENKVKETDRFYCENGAYYIAGHILHDHTSHGWLAFSEVIEQSSNIGTCKAAQVLGAPLLYRYIKLFGFGNKLGIDISGEISGMVRDLRVWSKTSITAVPMGQEVGVTALQLVSAISVIANGGQLMKPYLIKEIRDKYAETLKSFSPVLIRKVISIDTAVRVRNILTGVVEKGTGTLAKMDSVKAAGKTGTAQKIEGRGYSHSKFMASFVGFAPAEDPKIAIVVVVDEPHGSYYGGVVSAPVFKKVAEDSLKYLNTKQLPVGLEAK
ncbi:MAG: penicillin-binding transpeptidase domain-containing protein [Candidatus Omnitrophica bacterium]|nr:penicillin-binding transpeptidase domain-containing protein [Candidatus Omnitrophota bacterium]